jgi:hypothetical protein
MKEVESAAEDACLMVGLDAEPLSGMHAPQPTL